MGLGDGQSGRIDVGGITGVAELRIPSTGNTGEVGDAGPAAIHAYGQRNCRVAAGGRERVRPRTGHEVGTGAIPTGAARRGRNQPLRQGIIDRDRARGSYFSYIAHGDGVGSALSHGEIAGMGLGDGQNGSIDVGRITGAGKLKISSTGRTGKVDDARPATADAYG